MTADISGSRLAQDFVDFIDVLTAHRVQFVLVGGYALAVHGHVRATADIDFLYRCTEENVACLCVALEVFGAPPSVIDAQALLSPNTVTYFGVPPLRIDLLASISGVSNDEVFASALTTTVGSQIILVIGRDALIKNKKASGREKDRRDVRALEKGLRARRQQGADI